MKIEIGNDVATEVESLLKEWECRKHDALIRKEIMNNMVALVDSWPEGKKITARVFSEVKAQLATVLGSESFKVEYQASSKSGLLASQRIKITFDGKVKGAVHSEEVTLTFGKDYANFRRHIFNQCNDTIIKARREQCVALKPDWSVELMRAHLTEKVTKVSESLAELAQSIDELNQLQPEMEYAYKLKSWFTFQSPRRTARLYPYFDR